MSDEAVEKVESPEEEARLEDKVEAPTTPTREAPPIPALQEVVPDEARTGKVFALLVEGVVSELIEERRDIHEEWHEDIVSKLVDVTAHDPEVKVGWVEADGGLVAPAPFEPTPEIARNMAFAAGAKTKAGSTGKKITTYPMDPASWQQMTEVATHAKLFDEFPGGESSLSWPSSPPATFDSGAFVEMFKVLSAWRHRWNQHALGYGDPPSDVIEV